MAEKAQEQYYMVEMIKWFLVVILLMGGVVANYHFATQPLTVLLIGWVLVTPIILLIAFQTEKGRAAWEFMREARIELRKVVWPTRQETVQTTLVVAAMVLAMGLILWGIDAMLLWVITKFTG